ncbi:D-alanyl-D-alanine carboxypeptidase family protein [Pelagovum pacificum]|uniref:serine-type D-Ala-D-Ala carboxypeptidase n=1 Tax=Pelagovum pacificum TaxID=2588711 RepID=A0A5C5GAT2_9RHOB|nr:D-alanyl-D-alanine carboxypeptidase family protein [Pelagovum pacificum]QQA42019.1 D-alanyl-D-alanine carboxypeptidase [Pelagovum pacificum]TNY31110.1 D-alanyl-D-alanine carboxypeptidase [Pelagovum pacificum]
MRRRHAARLFLSLLLILGTGLSAVAQSFDTRARAAYVFDQTTGTVLLEKDADVPLPPASMSKLMTLYMAFEAIAQGRLQTDERLQVSEHAMSYGGSTMFLDTTDRPTVEDLLRGIIVLSGNDACAVIAEALSPDGTEAGFARLMTERGREMGLTNSTFVNSNGWPAAGHRMSVRDLGVLADHIITDYPTFYPLFAEQEFEFDGRAPTNTRNRNPLLSLNIGADGLKTGHTEEAGYGLVGSAKQGDRRIIFVISGLSSTAERAEESERIVNWAFRQFVQRGVTEAGTRIAEAEVWMGAQSTVGLTVTEDVELLMPVLDQEGITAEVVYTGPLEAPIEEGAEIAELRITREGLPDVNLPLVAESAVARGGFGQRVRAAAFVLLHKVAPEADLSALPGGGA